MKDFSNTLRNCILAVMFLIASEANAGYRYLRLTPFGAVSTYDIFVLEIDWMVGSTAYPTTHATGPIAGITATQGSGTAWRAFDGTSLMWAPGVTTYPFSISCDMGTGVSITPTEIKIAVEWNARCMSSFACEGSSDNINWTTLYSKSGLTESNWVRDATNSFVFAEGPTDVQVPTVPASLSSSAVTQTAFTLSWAVSADNLGVTGYEIYQGTTLVGITTANTFTMSELTAATAYNMTVRAKDAAGNRSAASQALIVTTLSNGYRYLRLTPFGGVTTYDIFVLEIDWMVGSTAYPTTHATGPTAGITATQGSGTAWRAFDGTGLMWAPGVTTYPYSITYDMGAGVSINPTEVRIANEWSGRTMSTFACEGSTDNINWTTLYSVSGLIESNWPSNATKNFVFASGSETQAPTVPAALSSSVITQTAFTLSWTACNDNVGVTGYEIYKGATLVGITTTNTFTMSGLTAATSYNMTVRAKDAAGNRSAASQALDVTTLNAGYRYLRLTPTGAVSTYDIFVLEIDWMVGTTAYPATHATGPTAEINATQGSGTAWRAFDGTSIMWAPGVTTYPFSITCDMGAGVSISPTEVQIAVQWNGRTMSSFFCEGSADNTNWTTLYTISGLVQNDWTSNATKSFVFFDSSDTQAPTVPTSLSSSAVTQSTFTLSWSASTDNVGVTGYEVYQGTALVGSPITNTFEMSALAFSTTYNMTVKAKDAAGNSSAQSTALNVTTSAAGSGTRTTNIGMNTNGNCDYNFDKPWTDAMRVHRGWNKIGSHASANDAPRDANGWPITDAQVLVYHNLFTNNNSGTYKMSFTGQATLASNDGTFSNKLYNSSTNTTTADFLISFAPNTELFITFSNTILTSGGATNTGVKNVKLMRPFTPGNTQSYAASQIIANDYLTKLAPFTTIRYMGWTQTNDGNNENTWANRIKWNKATVANAGGRANWESVIIMANAANKDAWICIPHQVDDNFITKIAQMFKYGSDGNEPYTSTQANPVVPPLNSNLKLYVEYSNEVWNWGGPYTQTPWVLNASIAYGAPLNFDGTTDQGLLMYRYKAMRTVQISNIFRSVFSSEMMTRVRPVICWQQGFNELTNRTLGFIDRWYNKRDSRSTWNDPHPVNYYLYGGGGSTYWYTDGHTTMNSTNLWDNHEWNPKTFQDKIYKDMSWAKAFGLAYINYEGDAHPTYENNDEAIMLETHLDSRMNAETVEHVNAATAVDGELFCFLVLQSTGYWGAINMANVSNSPQYSAIQSLAGTTAPALNRGSVAPFTRPGGAYDILTWEPANTNGTGTTTLSANTDGYKSGYSFQTTSTGTFNVQVEYNTWAAATLDVEYGGLVIGTFSLSNTSGVAAYTSKKNISCTADKMYSIRLVCTSGAVTIRNVIVASGPMSAPAYRTGLDSENASKLSVYPNPVKAGNFLTISGLKDGEPANIQITDLSGKVVRSERMTMANVACQLNTVGLSKGIYFLRISNNGNIANKKFIIE